MRRKRPEDVRMRCAHWGCEISAKMCLARQHVGRRGWQGDRYSFKSVPKDLYCMSDKCGQGLKVRQYMEDGDMEQIKEYLTGGAEKPGPARQNETAREKLEARTGERMCGICRKWFKHTEENFRMSAATKRLVATCRGCEKRFPKLRWKNGKPHDGEDATATPNVATATPNVATPTPEVAPVPLPRPTVQQASSSSTRTETEPGAPAGAPEPTKTCRRCGQELPVSRFNRNMDKRDGIDTICLECKSAAGKASRERLKAKRMSGSIPPHKAPLYANAPQPCAIPAAPAADRPGVVTVDFSCCPSVLETLEAISREEFRTPAQQILYFLAKNLAAKEAMSGVQSQKVG